MSDAASHFSTEAGGEPAGQGRFVHTGDIKPAEFVPGLEFRPVLGDKGMANFVHFEPDTEAPRHVHSEEQIVVVLEGEFTFDIDGQTRVMRKGDVAVIPSWVPHGAWTTDSSCLEVDFFSPPRTTLVALANQQLGAASAPSAPSPDAEA
jgi:quercetin dioxygenase-like cupin family protein